jgi:hypothetical protein
MKRGASLAADIWSVKEMRSLPQWALDRLAEVLMLIEEEAVDGNSWDKEALLAWISLIPKSEPSPLPGQQRPIVLLTLILRLWSSTRTRQMLDALAIHVPPQLRGGLKEREASDVFVMMAAFIESAHTCAFRASGVVFDIIKASWYFSGRPNSCLPASPAFVVANCSLPFCSTANSSFVFGRGC